MPCYDFREVKSTVRQLCYMSLLSGYVDRKKQTTNVRNSIFVPKFQTNRLTHKIAMTRTQREKK